MPRSCRPGWPVGTTVSGQDFSIEVRDAKNISSDVSTIVEDVLPNAASVALQDGYSIVVYATPITD